MPVLGTPLLIATWLLTGQPEPLSVVETSSAPRAGSDSAETSSQTESSPASDASSSSETILELIERQQQQLEELQERLDSAEMDLLESMDEDVEPDILRIYGFFETGAQAVWADEEDQLYYFAQVIEWSFILGDLHLYIDVNPPFRGWKALFEVRINTSVGLDTYGNFYQEAGHQLGNPPSDRLNRPGLGVAGDQLLSTLTLERAYIEYNYSDALGVRLGLWLTPFGIWNVDHGSPTLIALIEPYFTQNQAFPSHQLGLAAHGTFYFGAWDLSYHVGVSNGRMAGPDFTNIPWANYDFTNDKMGSARLQVRNSARKMTAGISALSGTTQVQEKFIGLTPGTSTKSALIELTEWAIGTDFSWDSQHLRLRAEAQYISHRYSDGARPETFGGYRPDARLFEGYVVTAFPIPFLGFVWEPYLNLQAAWWPIILQPNDVIASFNPGLNIFFTPTIQLKNQFFFGGRFEYSDFNRLDLAGSVFYAWSGRLVLSF